MLWNNYFLNYKKGNLQNVPGQGGNGRFPGRGAALGAQMSNHGFSNQGYGTHYTVKIDR